MGPLTGIEVLDFSSFIAGAYAASLLGDMGAGVVKVEPPGGDLARAWAPFLAGESRFFLGWNRNKRGVAVDLGTAPGREIAHALVRRADVVIENFRTGVTQRLGIDYETLRAVNPRIIYCTATAFGARGPMAARPGYDPVLQCLGGAALANARHNGGQPAISSVAVADFQAAMLIATGVCAALYHRERTGEGQKLETSLLQAVISVQPHHYVEGLECAEEGGLGIYPYRLYGTADGRIFIAGGTDKFWRLFCEAIGADELSSDPRYATNAQRVERATELDEKLEPYLKRRTTAEWETMLVAAGVPCGGVRSHAEFFVDPQVTAMDMNPVVEHPAAGRIRVSGVPVNFRATPGAIQRAAPLLGEHTEEILAELGYEAARREELRQAGVVK